MVGLGMVLVVLGVPLGTSGVGIVIARPITQRLAGGFAPIVAKGDTGRSTAIRRQRKCNGSIILTNIINKETFFGRTHKIHFTFIHMCL